MGAADAVDTLPFLTLERLFPEAFPLIPEFRSVLTSSEYAYSNELLLRFVYSLAYLPHDEAVLRNWQKDPFFRILVELDRKSCTKYVERNDLLIREKVRNFKSFTVEEQDEIPVIEVGSNQMWSLPQGFSDKQTVVNSVIRNVTGFFPSGRATKSEGYIFMDKHRRRRASELDHLLNAMVNILIYPRTKNVWPLAVEHRDKIEPRIPKVVDEIEQLGMKFQH